MISPSGAIDGIKNFFVGCGMNSVGIASAAGVGRALAHLIYLLVLVSV
jgi:glycine/D-amino acid oxidase-like deaminating enzyme